MTATIRIAAETLTDGSLAHDVVVMQDGVEIRIGCASEWRAAELRDALNRSCWIDVTVPNNEVRA